MLVRRYERSRIEVTGQLCLFYCQGESNDLIPIGSLLRIRGHPSALTCQTIHIKICANDLILKSFCLGKNGSVFSNQMLSSKDKICRRLALACCRVYIAADQTRRLCAHKASPITVFSNHFITGRKIYDHCRTGQRMRHTRRIWSPEILTELCRNFKTRHFFTLEEQIHAKRNLFSKKFRCCHRFFSRRKMTQLIKFIVVRQILFRHNAEKLSVTEHSGYIEQLSALFPRQSDKNQRIGLFRTIGNFL